MHATISDQQLLALAATYGTPLYVYDTATISRQYRKLSDALSGTEARIFYACKALTNPHILKHIYSLGAGIDCSSINEVKLALLAGAAPSAVLYTSNGIAFEEIAEAVALGVHVNIDSLSHLEKFGQTYGNSYPVGIRLRPNIMAGGNLKISTGHDSSKFGIPVEQLDQVLQLMEKYRLHIKGLHIHTGSEIKEVGVFEEGMEKLFQLVSHFPELIFLDLGGGFKVPYAPGDVPTDIVLLGERVQAAFSGRLNANGQPLQVWFEPGKYLVSECGYLLTTVNVLKPTGSVLFAGVDTGFNHLIRPMFYDSYHHIRNISNPQGMEKTYAVVGNICETDTFAWDRQLNEVREGDVLAIFNAGAYGFEMSSRFNSRFRPAEVMVHNGQPVLIRRRETFDQLLEGIDWPGK